MLVRIPKKPKKRSSVIKQVKDPIKRELLKRGYMQLSNPKVTIRVRKCLSTGLPALDVISAFDEDNMWGLPFGRQMEFAGKPDSGKTTMLIAIAAAAQRAGYTTIWVETEHSLNQRRAKTLGVDLDDLYIDTPEHLEEGLERIDKAIMLYPESNDPGFSTKNGLVICFDSIAATPTKAEIEAEISDSHIAVFARQMAQFQRRIVSAIGKRNVMVVYSNQLKDYIGFGYKKHQTYGGNAIRYHCGLRFETTYTGKIKKGTEVVGITMNIDNVKNKCITPFKNIKGLEFSFETGFNYGQTLLLALEERNLTVKTGPKYKIHPLGKTVEYKKADFIRLVENNPKVAKKLEECLRTTA